MRTTIRLDDGLLAEAKQFVARTFRTLTAMIGDALRMSLARGRAQARSPRPELPVFEGGHLMPGVDLDDSAALLDRMEERGD